MKRDETIRSKRTGVQIERDRAKCSLWFRQGYRTSEIHKKLCKITQAEGYAISYQMVALDIKKILQDWKDEHRENINARMETELAKLDLIESQMWEAWIASKEGERKTKMVPGENEGDTKFAEGIHTTSTGDVKFITRIQWCIEMRAKLLGYFTPTDEPDEYKNRYGELWDSSVKDIRTEMNKLYSKAKISGTIGRLN